MTTEPTFTPVVSEANSVDPAEIRSGAVLTSTSLVPFVVGLVESNQVLTERQALEVLALLDQQPDAVVSRFFFYLIGARWGPREPCRPVPRAKEYSQVMMEASIKLFGPGKGPVKRWVEMAKAYRLEGKLPPM